MPTFPVPAAAVPADLPRGVRLQIVSPRAKPPDGDGWLHEIKHDGHQLVAIVAGYTLRPAEPKLPRPHRAVSRAVPGTARGRFASDRARR